MEIPPSSSRAWTGTGPISTGTSERKSNTPAPAGNERGRKISLVSRVFNTLKILLNKQSKRTKEQQHDIILNVLASVKEYSDVFRLILNREWVALIIHSVFFWCIEETYSGTCFYGHNPTGPITISEIRRSANFMQFRIVVRRILKLQNCKRAGWEMHEGRVGVVTCLSDCLP